MDDSGKNMAFWNTLFGKSGEESVLKKIFFIQTVFC